MDDALKRREELAGKIREFLQASTGDVITLTMDRDTAEALADDLDVATYASNGAPYTRADLRAFVIMSGVEWDGFKGGLFVNTDKITGSTEILHPAVGDT